MITQDLLIPCGYIVEQHNETVDIAIAGQILSGKKQRKYTSALGMNGRQILSVMFGCVLIATLTYPPTLSLLDGSRRSKRLNGQLFRNGHRFKCQCLSDRI